MWYIAMCVNKIDSAVKFYTDYKSCYSPEAWVVRAGNELVSLIGKKKVRVSFEKFPEKINNIVGYANVEDKVIYLNMNYVRTFYNMSNLLLVIAHEIGHVKGLEHEDVDKFEVMNAKLVVDEKDREIVSEWIKVHGV